MKIAIIVREETMKKCTGKGCFNAFFTRIDAFEHYPPDTELAAFTHHGGDLAHKIEKLKENGVTAVHLSTCMRAKAPEYEALAQALSVDFDVIGYTHGSAQGKTRETVSILKQHV